MPSSNRLHYLAIGGCLAFLLLAIPALGQPPESAGIAEGEPAESSAPASPPENNEPEPAAAAPEPAPVEQPAQPDSASDTERENNYYASEDLKAQQAMAEATDTIATLTIVQIVLGAIGTIALIVTLIEARRATNLTSGTTQSQMRAYVAVAAVRIVMEEGGIIRATTDIRNNGQTPARKMTVRCTLTVANLPFSGTADVNLWENDRMSVSPLHAGITVKARQTFDKLTPLGRQHIAEGKLGVFVHGEIRYKDVFQKPHTTTFRFMHTGHWGGQRAMEVCEEGNEED